jgi:hypothetical protein
MLPPAKFSRRVVDPVNSIAWFAMDALWLGQVAWGAYTAAAMMLLTGLILILMDRPGGSRLDDDLALNAWMWMNAAWVVSDLGSIPALRQVALGIACVAALLVANAMRPSRVHEGTGRHLKKMRVGR